MRTVLLAVAVVAARAVSVEAGLIFSDDFEAETVPPDPPGYIENYRDFQHWDVLGTGVDMVGPGTSFPPRIDSLMVDLDGTSGSTLITKQTFDLFPGTYTLRFDLGGPVGGVLLDTVQVELGTVFNELFTIQRGDPFITVSRSIEVTSPTNGRLSFTDLGADSNGAFLDDVSLTFTPVPEPSSLVLLLIGATGLARVRRRTD